MILSNGWWIGLILKNLQMVSPWHTIFCLPESPLSTCSIAIRNSPGGLRVSYWCWWYKPAAFLSLLSVFLLLFSFITNCNFSDIWMNMNYLLLSVEAINLANQLCQYGYFFPVNDLKNLVLKDDSSLYRFQVSKHFELLILHLWQ